MKKHALVIAAILLAVLPSAALAKGRQMEVAMQDDLTILNTQANRDLALIQFKGMGGSHVRITIDHTREGKLKNSTSLYATTIPLSYIDAAINRVREFGLVPQVTLFWRDQTDKYKLADWMYNVVHRLGARVNRYSILNEPDLYMPEMHKCDDARQQWLAQEFPGEMTRVDGVTMAKIKTKGGVVSLKRACQRYERGLSYHHVYGASAKAVREANKNAQIQTFAERANPTRSPSSHAAPTATAASTAASNVWFAWPPTIATSGKIRIAGSGPSIM